MASTIPNGPVYPAGVALANHLQTGQLHALYVVTGAENPVSSRDREELAADPAMLRAASRVIEQAALVGGDPALDLVTIDYLDGDRDGEGVHVLAVKETRNVSLFGGRRVVTILHADGLAFAGPDAEEGATKKKKAASHDPLQAVIEGLEVTPGRPPFVLIVVADHIDRRRKVWKTLLQHGALVEVPLMTQSGLADYFAQEAKPLGITVGPGASDRIWERLGSTDPSRLRQSVDRLLLDAGPHGTVTTAMVDASVPVDRDASVFAISEALAKRDATRAITVLQLLLDHASATESERTAEVMKTFGMLSSHYQALVKIDAVLARRPNARADDIAHATGLHPYRVGKMMFQLEQMRPGTLEQAIASLDQADTLLKSSAIGDRKLSTGRWLERLILALANGTPLRTPSAPHVFETLG